MERTRRDKKPVVDKFAQLRAARESGGRSKQWKQDDEELYTTVDEDEYKKIVKGRLEEDDFIVGDRGEGYVDNGMDGWEDGDRDRRKDGHSDDSEEERKKQKKKAKAAKAAKPTKPKPEPATSVVPAANPYRPVVSAAKEQDFMDSLLNSMDTAPVSLPRKRKSSPPPIARTGFRSAESVIPSSDPPSGGESSHRSSSPDWSSPVPASKRVKVESSLARVAISDTNGKGKAKEVFDDDYPEADTFDDVDMHFDDIDDFGLAAEVTEQKPITKEEKMDIDWKTTKPTVNGFHPKKDEDSKTEPLAWLSLHASLLTSAAASTPEDALASSAAGSVNSGSKVDALESDGSLRMYWLDYLELEGKVYFVGKVLDKTDASKKKWVSCCVTVEGIQRNLFVLPRDKRFEEGHPTDVTPSQQDVFSDFDAVRRQAGVKAWRAKFVKRKYAFGQEGVREGESEWLKVVYGFNEPPIPAHVSSPNFSHVFGTGTSAFELLVMKRKIMGPCWLDIKNPEISQKGVSWCKLEVVVKDPKDVNPFPESDSNAPKDIPPLTVLSLAVKTVVNHRENKREIVCASARIWENVNLEDPTPPEKQPSTLHTVVRALDKFPGGFEVRAKSEKSKILTMANERMLLANLLVTLQKYDPDVIVGHEFLGVTLDVLLHRLRELKVDHWSRIGRFRRTKWPVVGKQGTNIKFMNGRILCDMASDGAKSMIISTTWSLTEMCQTQLKIQREDIDPDDTAVFFDGTVSNPDRLLHFVRHCEMDSFFQMAIASKVQMLALTKQLTNLAGNSWNKTLNGGRAERNEYILLHEFHRLKYICPDKTYGKKAVALAVKAEAEDIEAGPEGSSTKTAAKGKRDKYKGGLVFEPKRGLWDKYVLVMDFNSLYPSIIQEWNIDFTTVDKTDDMVGEGKIPDVPSPDVPQGVLPRLIATLVQRRRQVKGLMKERGISQTKLLQYDIKQQALKLTANSMYGCLGFEYSRFYARPLAALTTFKGREILTHTKELAESLNLDVVYGDTDSVFVNSNVTDLAEALKFANEFKKKVNERYKLLEIDLDSVFQRLLLLQKKKYAALKVEDGGRTSTEIKGLDMKRREYCALSKNVSNFVLQQILSGEATETVVEKIHEYLTTMGESVRKGEVNLDDFIIFKRLGKNPEDYPDAKSQPHVQVALRMKTKGGSARSGDVISYIFCLGDDGQTARTAQADKAHHPDDLRKAGSTLKIDYELYLAQQVLPPIERLCDPIEGTDRARLAECLGLDPGRYQTSVGSVGDDRPFSTLDSQISERERYLECDPFTITCRKCNATITVNKIGSADKQIITLGGPRCYACPEPLGLGSIQIQLEHEIRRHIAKYYEGWTVCDDPTCGNRTRMMGVYGRKCLRSGCRGSVTFEYSDLKLYNQLMFYSSLFKPPPANVSAKASAKQAEIDALMESENNIRFLGEMNRTIEKYLDRSGRRWVELSDLFAFMKV